MRILITGACGFVGYHLITKLKEQAVEIHALHRGEVPSRFRTFSKVHFHQCDILEREKLASIVQKIQPQQVYHLAGYSDAGKSFKEPMPCWDVNLQGTFNLYDALVKLATPLPRVVHASSGAIYGEAPTTITEDTPFCPLHPYGSSKAAADVVSYQYTRQFPIEIIRARAFNHIGSGQATRFALASFAHQIAAIEKQNSSGTLQVGDLSAERDFCDVRDIVDAYILLMEKGQNGEAYNIASGVSYPMRYFLDELLKLSPAKIVVEQEASRLRPQDAKHLRISIVKIQKECRWNPVIPMETMLRDFLNAFRNDT